MANTTAIGAVLDKQTIKVYYQHSHDTNVAASKLTFTLKHHYTSKAGNSGQLDLEHVSVPVDFIRVGLKDSSYVYETAVEFVNPKYYKNLSVHVNENYMGIGSAAYQCDVLSGDDDLIVPLPVNPIRPPQFPENEPPMPLPDTSLNVITPEPAVAPYSYALKSNGVSVAQYSKKILYNAPDNKFYETIENEVSGVDSLYIENGISNFLENSFFNDIFESEGSNKYPSKWHIAAPGFIVSSGLFESDISNLNFWQLHLTNPNSFSALDSIALKTVAEIPVGTSQLTMSFRYQQFIGDIPVDTEVPFESIYLKNSFLASDGSIISQSTIPASLKYTSDVFWETVSFSFPCPTSAVKVSISLETGSITTTLLSTLRIILPQLENCYVATTPCESHRLSDQIYSPSQLKFTVPVGFVIETTHTSGPEVRGFLELNQAAVGGLRIYLSNGKLNLRQVDGFGSIIFTAQSATIQKNSGELAKYCVFIDSGAVYFYCDGILVSSTAASLSFDYFSNLTIGSLLANNTSINSKLTNIVVTSIKPGA